MARLLIDGANVLWRSLSVGKDPEGYKARDPEDPSKEVYVNTAGYGFENALQMMHAALNRFALAPKDMIFVWEGMNPTISRTRRAQNATASYKGTRGKRPARAYIEYKEAQDMLQRFFLDLGAACCVQDEVEGDDVLAFLASKAEEEVIVFTHDGDMTRLVGQNEKGISVLVGNNDWVNINPYGPFPNSLITLYKSLVGDTNDNIKGAKGFGDKSFLKLLAAYGVHGLTKLEELVVGRRIPELNELAETDKLIRAIVDNEQAIYDSYTLALLYPQDVDTARKPLQWTYGMVRDAAPNDDHRYRQWYGQRTLVHAGNYRDVVKWAARTAENIIALDLETTTSEESDEWMALRKKRDEDAGIDVLSSEIVSCGLTFGDNFQHSIYLTHRHDPSDGIEQITEEQLGAAIQHLTRGKRVVCHNAGGFELPVLRRHFMFDGDEQGFMPDVHCTKLLVNYVNENLSTGLKSSAKTYFNYDQQTYMEVTGGKKMDQLTATHVLSYGTDDTVVTAALYNHLSFRCQTEDTWKVYCEVEPVPMYLQAHAFLEGARFSLQRMREIEEEDEAAYAKAWHDFRQFLIDHGWAGSVCPTYTKDITPKEVKEAFLIVYGEPLDTGVRKPDKLVAFIEALDKPEFADALRRCYEGEALSLNGLVQLHFDGEPKINLNSWKQVAHLMYEVLGLPVRLRNDVSDAMRAKGEDEGNPSTNELAIQMALHYDKGGKHPGVLKALLALKTIETRRKMYYGPYAHVAHFAHTPENWIHASFNQCATVTRRYTCTGPNLQQLPKKGEGLKFREVLLAHHEDAVVVSMDFSGQELRLMAEDSQDPMMLDCYVGENLKDLHSITGAGISNIIAKTKLTYDEVVSLEAAGDPVGKFVRAKGKTVNFSTQYGAMARKLGLTLLVEEEEAQAILDARNAIFHVSEKWKEDYIALCRRRGYATTRLGARRHLRELFNSKDFRIAGKAERQGPNFRIQGSGAEMTKLAMRAMWERGIFFKYDAKPIGPVHDEYVASVALKDLKPFLREMHACMTQPYSGMRVPIVSSISFGWNFGKQVEIGETPTDEAIDRGLAKLLGTQESSYGEAA